MLKLIDITKKYRVGEREIKALDKVSIDFRENEFAAVLGQSGSGKTTLLNIIGGLDKYTSGELAIYGKSTKKYADKDWDNYRNKKIGFVFQSYNLIPHLNVLENVELALTISGISASERRQMAIDALDNVGLKDYLKNKPNQLSGGQMQRVAIARALVNKPDILLADEPTGALDSQTSLQIMELIKKISKNKLVIMVTHNSALANKYASRIINLQDGRVSHDSNPFVSEDSNSKHEQNVFKKSSKKVKAAKKEKTSMTFFTALSLSFRNLLTKKARTIMISIASSIGIIGVCLVLALSNGLNKYIDKLQADTISSSPITITQQVADTQALSDFRNNKQWQKFPSAEKIFVEQALKMQDFMKTNVITQNYINYLSENIKQEWVNDVMYKNGLALNIYTLAKGNSEYIKVSPQSNYNTLSSLMGNRGLWQQMPDTEFVQAQYDIYKDMPTEKNHLLLVVDEYNRVRDNVLVNLGLRNIADENMQINFEEVIGHEFKIATNNQIYDFKNGSFELKHTQNIAMEETVSLKIVGIARLNSETIGGTLSTGLAYLPSLADWLLEENLQSDIVTFMNENPNLNPLTGEDYLPSVSASVKEQQERDIIRFGASTLPNEVNIYAKDLNAKEKIKNVLNAYNQGKVEEDFILYSDLSETVGLMLSSMVNTITYVLVGFSAVSLIVSSIMIAILTYVSVIERTKEIGILRSIGARKKDISRVFNAETFILGGLAGLIGVGTTFLLSLPINKLLNRLAEVKNIASLSVITGSVMLLVSIGLSVISGFLPSKKAAKKDPVLALRSE